MRLIVLTFISPVSVRYLRENMRNERASSTVREDCDLTESRDLFFEFFQKRTRSEEGSKMKKGEAMSLLFSD